MQRIGRGFLIRRITKEALENCKKTRARRLGLRVIRNFIKRCRIHRAEKRVKLAERVEVRAASRLVRWWRRDVMFFRSKRQGAAVLIIKIWRGYSAREFGIIHWHTRKQVEKRVKAASVICRYARMMVKRAREELALQVKRRNVASCRIQGLARGRQGRKVATEVRHQAAIAIASRVLSRALRRWLAKIRKRLKWLNRAEDEVRMAAKLVIKCLVWR